MIEVTHDIAIDEGELEEKFIRSSGPGGQNVNRVRTAVQLRFDAHRSPNLPEDVRARLGRIAGRRMTESGVLIIEGRRFRTREQNRVDVRGRLIGLIRKAAKKPKVRRRTRPSQRAKLRRLESKRRRGAVKRLRRSAGPGGEDRVP